MSRYLFDRLSLRFSKESPMRPSLIGKKVVIKTFIMDPWGWAQYPPPLKPNDHVFIKSGTLGHVIAHANSVCTVDYIDERNILCRTDVEDQYVLDIDI